MGNVEHMGDTPLAGGTMRYGLLGVFDTEQGREVKLGLTRMTLEIPNRRLQRRSDSS